MTGLSRVAERAAQRRRRRDRVRAFVAGSCLVAGIVLFATSGVGNDTGSAAAPAPPQQHPGSSGARALSATFTPSAPALPIVISGGAAGATPGPAQFSDPAVVSAVLTAATAEVEAVDSYDYRTLDTAITAGLAATTGEFQRSYRSAMTGPVAAAASASRTVQRGTVQKVGITAVSSDQRTASALVLARLLTTASSTAGATRTTPVTLGVTLQSVGGTWLISAMSEVGTSSVQAQPPGTPALYSAAVAGAQEVVNLLTFSRASYDADFARALSGLTGPLVGEQQGQKQSILDTLTVSHADYVGQVRGIGIESADGDSILMLVAATSYQVNAAGLRTVQSLPELEVGVVRIDGIWRVDQFQSVGTG